jgi:hypothetical protein
MWNSLNPEKEMTLQEVKDILGWKGEENEDEGKAETGGEDD